MTGKTISILQGDDPEVISAAESVISAVAPDINLVHGEIGRTAYEHSGSVFPSETADLIVNSDSVLCGRTDLAGLRERDPIFMIKKQMNLFTEVNEYYPLRKKMGCEGIDLVTISPVMDMIMDIRELESLDGVTTDGFISSESIGSVFEEAVRICEARRRKNVTFITDSYVFPTAARMSTERFRKCFAATEFSTEELSTEDVTCRLTLDPSSIEAVITGTVATPSMCGQAAGMIGGTGLMPHAYVGKTLGIYTPSNCFNSARKENPTSAVLSAALMLLNMGRERSYDLIKKSVREMYRLGKTTPDVGGILTPSDFTKGLLDTIAEFQ